MQRLLPRAPVLILLMCGPPSCLLCPAGHKSRRNCELNPNCLHGLGMERKEGIWASNPKLLQQMGEDPNKKVRDLATHKPVGLRNLGATCYMNSMVQVLFMNREFRECVYRWRTGGTEGKEWREIVQQLQVLFIHLDQSRRSSYNPETFVECLKLARGYGTWRRP